MTGIAHAIAFAWNALPGPERTAALLAAAVAAVMLCPLAVLLAPGLPGVLVPRRRRIAWRQRHPHSRPAVPRWLHRAVLAADRHRCVYCGNTTRPQLDHIRPWAAGGLTTPFNLAVLCVLHNKIKSNFSVDPDGYVHYRPFQFPGIADPATAAAILAAERRARLSPARWIRGVRALT